MGVSHNAELSSIVCADHMLLTEILQPLLTVFPGCNWTESNYKMF